MKKLYFIIILISLVSVKAICQEKEEFWIKPDSLYKFVQPTASMQFWSVYSMQEKAQITPDGPLEGIQDRLNFIAKRARFGFKGAPYPRLKYNVTVQYDNIGKDRFSSPRGGTNTGQLGILDAYMTWRASKSELFNVTFGYFHPQISRECITGDMLINSFDKSFSQGYIRTHINGKGYGRSTGVNLGGIRNYGLISLGYNTGIFNNNTTAEDQKKYPETAGRYWNLLFAERLTISFGEPDKKKYSINYDVNNYFNERKGITIGLNRTTEGRSEIFSSNYSSGVDVIINYSNLNLDGEWFWLTRNNEGRSYQAQTGHARIGYNLILNKKYFIEPSFMYTSFTGDPGYKFTGQDNTLDFGVNWYLNKKNLKLAAHYVKQAGNGNNNFTDELTYQKGDMAGLAFVLIL